MGDLQHQRFDIAGASIVGGCGQSPGVGHGLPVIGKQVFGAAVPGLVDDDIKGGIDDARDETPERDPSPGLLTQAYIKGVPRRSVKVPNSKGAVRLSTSADVFGATGSRAAGDATKRPAISANPTIPAAPIARQSMTALKRQTKRKKGFRSIPDGRWH